MAGTNGQRGRRRGRIAGLVGAVLLAGGGSAIGVAATSQDHAPQPTRAVAGTIGPLTSKRSRSSQRGALPAPKGDRPARRSPSTTAGARASSKVDRRSSRKPTTATTGVVGPSLSRSLPVGITIPAIGVHSKLQYVGLNPNGTIQVPPLNNPVLTNEAAWYKYSPTPGQPGPSIIEGHVDSAAEGPSVFFHLGALKPGDKVYVTLKDKTVAVFTVTGVREYPKSHFPTLTVYGNTDYAALRLLTCGGQFDYQTRHYLSNIVVFASLTSSHPLSQGVAPS